MSSIMHAILFYSKKNRKSLELKALVKSVNLDMDLISVDSEQVRNLLLQDERFGIDRVPCVLLIYENGHFKTFIGDSLDNWFTQLMENINSTIQPVQETQDYFTPITEESFTQIEPEPSLYTKPLSSSKNYHEIKGSLPPPGRIKADNIGGINTIIEIQGEKPHVSKEVKKEGPSPAEVAKQLAEQREAMEEEFEKQRPF